MFLHLEHTEVKNTILMTTRILVLTFVTRLPNKLGRKVGLKTQLKLSPAETAPQTFTVPLMCCVEY